MKLVKVSEKLLAIKEIKKIIKVMRGDLAEMGSRICMKFVKKVPPTTFGGNCSRSAKKC